MNRHFLFRFWKFSLALIFVAGLAASSGVPAKAAEHSKVMLILDASGSMWGKVDGKPKIEIARHTIRNLMRNWNKNVDIGLMAYGHRSKGDCNDIQTLLPVGPARPKAIVEAVDKLTPKGKTPLTEAVKRAAQQLKFTEGKATVILVTDGKETCNADPCAAAKALKKLGVDFTVHVVGFNIKKGEQRGLKCLAQNTGGLYLSADNAQQLNAALKTAVVKVTEHVKTAPAKPKPPVRVAKPGHFFTAVLAPGGKPVTDNMRWDIYQAAKDVEGKRKNVKGTYDAQPRFVLNPGKYVVVARYGNAVAQQEFDVKDAGEAVKHVIVLNAGLFGVKAVYAENSEVVKSGMRWDIYATQTGLDGKKKNIVGTYDSQPVFRLTAGRYQLVARRDVAQVTKQIEIVAGKRSDLTVNLNAGLLAPTAVPTEGAAVLKKGMRWDVYSVDKDLNGKRKNYRGTYDATPVFTLTAGKYLLVVSNDQARKNLEVEINAGKRTAPVVNLNAGLLAPRAVLTNGSPALNKGMRWDVYAPDKDLNGNRKAYRGTYDAKPTFMLGAGKYLLRVSNGQAKKDVAVEVKAGKRIEPVIDLNAGRIRLVAKTKDGATLTKNLRWDIYTPEKNLEGKRTNIVGTYDASPTFTLPAGKFHLILQVGDARQEADIEVKPGDSKQVEVALQ